MNNQGFMIFYIIFIYAIYIYLIIYFILFFIDFKFINLPPSIPMIFFPCAAANKKTKPFPTLFILTGIDECVILI